MSLFTSTIGLICFRVRFQIDRSFTRYSGGIQGQSQSDELEECPNDTPGFRMSKSADKSAYSGIYIALNLFPDINPLVCEFLKIIRFELAVWMTAECNENAGKAGGVSCSTGNEYRFERGGAFEVGREGPMM